MQLVIRWSAALVFRGEAGKGRGYCEWRGDGASWWYDKGPGWWEAGVRWGDRVQLKIGKVDILTIDWVESPSPSLQLLLMMLMLGFSCWDSYKCLKFHPLRVRDYYFFLPRKLLLFLTEEDVTSCFHDSFFGKEWEIFLYFSSILRVEADDAVRTSVALSRGPGGQKDDEVHTSRAGAAICWRHGLLSSHQRQGGGAKARWGGGRLLAEKLNTFSRSNLAQTVQLLFSYQLRCHEMAIITGGNQPITWYL